MPADEFPERGVNLELDAARRACPGFRIDITITHGGPLYAAVREDTTECTLYSVVSSSLAEICETVRTSLEAAQAAGSA